MGQTNIKTDTPDTVPFLKFMNIEFYQNWLTLHATRTQEVRKIDQLVIQTLFNKSGYHTFHLIYFPIIFKIVLLMN